MNAKSLRPLCALLVLLTLCSCEKELPPETTTAATTTAVMTTTEQPTTQEVPQEEVNRMIAGLEAPAKNFAEILQRYKEILAAPGWTIFGSYSIYDMDGDHWPELLIKFGFCEADFRWLVYTMQENKASFIGDFNGGHTILYTCSKGGVYYCYGHMGYETVGRIMKRGNQLTEITIIEPHDANETGYFEPSDGVYINTNAIEHFSY